MHISSLFGKPVLSPCGTSYGYVKDVRLCRGYRKIACLVCADANEELFYLPMRTVKSVQDALIVGKARLELPTGFPSPIGLPAYTYTGTALGRISDLSTDEGILLIRSDRTEISASVGCAMIAETVILYPDPVKRRAADRNRAEKRSEPEILPPAEPPLASPAEPPTTPPDSVPPTPPTPPTPSAPRGFSLNRNDLLGKHVRRSVYDKTGAILAVAGECITPAVLSRARRAGKLLQLTVNTLTDYY